MFKCRTAEKNDLESIYKKSSILAIDSYRPGNEMVIHNI